MKTNLELAHDTGAWLREWAGEPCVIFEHAHLDVFAERIRADAIAEYVTMTTKGAKAWADVPNATAWVDELRGNAPAPE